MSKVEVASYRRLNLKVIPKKVSTLFSKTVNYRIVAIELLIRNPLSLWKDYEYVVNYDHS